MHLLTRFLATVLGLAIALTAVAYVAEATTWNAGYLKSEATHADLATKLSLVLPDLTTNFALPVSAKATFAQLVTPAYVQSQLDMVLPALVSAFRSGARVPSLDLSGLSQQASLSGIALPAGLSAVLSSHPPVVPANIASPLRTLGSATGQLLWLGPLVILITAALIFLIGGHRRLSGLATGALIGAVATALSALATSLPPRLIGAALDSSIARPLVPSVRSFADMVALDQAHRLYSIAAGLVVLAGILIVAHLIVGLIMRFRPRHKPAPEV